MRLHARIGICTVAAVGVVGTGVGPAAAGTRHTAAHTAGHTAASSACTRRDATLSCTYSGTAETIVVPAGTWSATVDMAGASGGDNKVDGKGAGGAGFEMAGRLAVAPGDVVTVGVGGRGANPDGSGRPGNGGWGLDNRGGGRGGLGKDGDDGGAGGGGSSLLKVNSNETVVASGGGGATRRVDGGVAGAPVGSQGDGMYDTGGYGGSPEHPYNSRTGATPDRSASGGGGGGGGYYSGQGGRTNWLLASGGGGGGGGSWDHSAFTLQTAARHHGDGFVRITLALAPQPPMALTTGSGDKFAIVTAGSDVPVRLQMPADATGEVGFYNDNVPGSDKGVGVAKLVDGVATYDVPAWWLPLGFNHLTACYGGNSRYAASDSSPITILVDPPKR